MKTLTEIKNPSQKDIPSISLPYGKLPSNWSVRQQPNGMRDIMIAISPGGFEWECAAFDFVSHTIEFKPWNFTGETITVAAK